jgi:glutamyl/glutaminyl-tRNA synthetase
VQYDDDAVRKHLGDPQVRSHLTDLARELGDAMPFDEQHVEVAVRRSAEKQDIKAATLIHAIRVALTGRAASPGIFDVIALLGRDRVLDRIAALIAFLDSRN